jgi:excisionase family DNA binding protein
MKDNNLLTPKQVAEILQMHTLTIYHYIRQGKLDAIHLGRSYRVAPQDLVRFIEAHRTNNTGKLTSQRRRIRHAF